MSLDRDVDMMTTGKSHADEGRWKVGFKKDGRITALRLQLFANGGCFEDLSKKVSEKSLMHVDNVYE